MTPIISPISSRAAAISGVAPESEGLSLFISSIPYNFRALLTLTMIVKITPSWHPPTVSAVSFVGFILAGFIQSALIVLMVI